MIIYALALLFGIHKRQKPSQCRKYLCIPIYNFSNLSIASLGIFPILPPNEYQTIYMRDTLLKKSCNNQIRNPSWLKCQARLVIQSFPVSCMPITSIYPIEVFIARVKTYHVCRPNSHRVLSTHNINIFITFMFAYVNVTVFIYCYLCIIFALIFVLWLSNKHQ